MKKFYVWKLYKSEIFWEHCRKHRELKKIYKGNKAGDSEPIFLTEKKAATVGYGG